MYALDRGSKGSNSPSNRDSGAGAGVNTQGVGVQFQYSVKESVEQAGRHEPCDCNAGWRVRRGKPYPCPNCRAGWEAMIADDAELMDYHDHVQL